MKTEKAKRKNDLATPCLVLDVELLDQNLKTMQVFAASHGKQLRPHAKTHKCSQVARRQAAAGAIGICAAKLAEAETLVRQGLRRVLITGPVVTDAKLQRLPDCLRLDPDLMLVVDHDDVIRRLDQIVGGAGVSLNVLVDLDVGLGRTGVAPAQALDLARRVMACRALRLRGLQAYAGHVQHIPDYQTRRQASWDALARACAAWQQFQQNGLPAEIFTGAGTGTYDIDVAVPELTELQPGSYAVMDAEYAAIGSAGDAKCFVTFHPALTLLTTVVSVNQHGFVTVDAGLKSLYRDGAKPQVVKSGGREWVYDWFGDEYGKISFPANTPAPALGAVLELMVSHCDPTINLFDCFYITRAEEVVDCWPIDLRGHSQ